MGRFVDFTGFRFNNLTVISTEIKEVRKYCTCRCDCGKMISVRGDDLKRRKSCGCKKNKKHIDMIGVVYGDLVIVKYLRFDIKSQNTMWEARCKCGRTRKVRGSDIRRGTAPKSCNTIGGKKPLNIKGRRYGYLVAKNYQKIVNGFSIWAFQCDCGTTRDIIKKNVTSGQVGSCGCKKGNTGNYLEMTGARFGKLTAISRVEDSYPTRWVFLCDCGKRKTLAMNHVRNGTKKCCGCSSNQLKHLARMHISKNMITYDYYSAPESLVSLQYRYLKVRRAIRSKL